MEKGTTTGDVTVRGVKPNANVQSAVAQLWDNIRNAGEVLVAVREENRSLSGKLRQAETALQENRDAIAGIDAEREAFRAQLAARDAEITALQLARADAEENMAARDTSLSEYTDRLERYEETIRRLTAELDTQDRTVKELQSKLEERHTAHEELERMRSEAGTHNATIIELREKLAANSTAAKDAEYLRAELVRRNTELNARIKEAMHHRERSAELESKLFEFNRVQAAFAQTREQLETVQAELQTAIQAGLDAGEQIQKYEEECQVLRTQLDENQQLEKERLAELEDKLLNFEQEQSAFAQTREQLEAVQAELQTAVQAGLDAEARIQQYEEECNALRSRLDENRNLEAELLTRIQQLNDDSDVYRRLAEEQQKDVIELSAQVLQLKAAIPQYEEQTESLNIRILSLEEELVSARAARKTADAEIATLREAKGVIEQLLREREQENARLLVLEDELTSMRTARESADAEIATLRGEKESTEEMLRQYEQEREQLQSRCEVLQQEVREMTQRTITRDFVEEKQVLVGELQAQLQEKEQEAEKLRLQLDAAYTSGSLFTAGTSHASSNERATVVTEVQELLKKVEYLLEGKE